MLTHSRGQELDKSIVSLLQCMRRRVSKSKFSSYDSFNLPIGITKMYNLTHVKIPMVSTELLYLRKPNPDEPIIYPVLFTIFFKLQKVKEDASIRATNE
jgi:hypothetical protein